MDNCLLTVLMPTYNHGSYIKNAIESVIDQKTKYPFMIWVIDDCSTDGTTEICRDLRNQYPEKIKLRVEKVNTKGRQIFNALAKINTKYFTILEGDDCWCDENKIQIAISYLEKHPEYTIFAHDTLYKDFNSDQEQSLVHEVQKVKIVNPVSMHNAPYLHTSSRICRNIIDFDKYKKHWAIISGDIYIYSYLLDKGPLYYYDKIMSIYNITGSGAWSGLSHKQQTKDMDTSLFRRNLLLSYRHDEYFTDKVNKVVLLKKLKKLLGKKLGWYTYIKIINFVKSK